MNLRFYEKDDETAINELFLEIFYTYRSNEQWRWDYTNPELGFGEISLAEENNKLIGHSGVIPITFNFLGKEIVTGKLEDSMVSKPYRLMGIFRKLVDSVSKESQKKGRLLLWGANKASFKVRIKLGFKHLFSLKPFVSIVNYEKVYFEIFKIYKIPQFLKWPICRILIYLSNRLKNRKKKFFHKTAQNVTIKRVNEFDKHIDELWDKYIENKEIITIKRSSIFLNWRFAHNPYRKYGMYTAEKNGELVGYLIAGVADRNDLVKFKIGSISDFVILDGNEDAYKALIQKAFDYWTSEKVDILISWVHNSLYSKDLLRILKKLGFIYAGSKFEIPIVFESLSSDISNESLKKTHQWFVTSVFSGRWI